MARQIREIEDAGFAKFAEPGDRAEGPVLSFEMDGGTTYDGEICPAITLDAEEGPTMVTLDKPQLLRKVLAARPVPGLWMRIQFVEERESNNGRWYKYFGVWVATDDGGGDGDRAESSQQRRAAPRSGQQSGNRPDASERPRDRQTDSQPARRPSSNTRYEDEVPF